ncbi:bacillithiol biosynthesis cysteine-adding enzyme BshC [Spongiimicrobium salis]|uniref:bacillithiol biosynthesis cysteine-adding enzyme BshC n=1 Tax=Spongiimicrobium salis TaxID=1667022 RepID=UPI00374C95F1
MSIKYIPFQETGYFSKLICDYVEEKTHLRSFYNRYPNLENFKEQLEEKGASFSKESRKVLHDCLEAQYKDTVISKATAAHINSLKEEKTFTVVTGHQLNLFTGPLYFLYKIISTINLTKELKEAYPAYNFVPIYWMATEDHDFEEINYFNYTGKKIQWNKEATGAVGHLDTKGLDIVYTAFAQELGGSINANTLKEWFGKAYLEHDNLTAATRYLANALFGTHGLVIVDGDDHALKKQLIPYAKRDILENSSFKAVSNTIHKIAALPEKYNIQVNPREINYFYLGTGDIRERIVADENGFYINGTDIRFTEKALLEELERYPERFSPNVIARPLYQEVILPNLCYIGGGGELAYWLELKASFELMGVPFPMLLLRNSVLAISEKQFQKLEKLHITPADLFLKQNSFINKKIRQISNINIDFAPQKKVLEEQFAALHELAEQTDASFLGAVKAQEVKQKKGLDHLEKRLLKAQKRKLKDQVVRITDLQNELFPGQSLQERNQNFSELYLEYGENLIPQLLSSLKPLAGQFTILKLQ